MFGGNKDEVTKGWRIFHNQKLHNLYSSLRGPSVQGGWGQDMGAVVQGKDEKAYSVSVSKQGGKKKRRL